MKYIKRKIDNHGEYSTYINTSAMLSELMKYRNHLPPKASSWILDARRYDRENSKSLNNFYLQKISISPSSAAAVFSDDIYSETFIYDGLKRYINRPIEAKFRMVSADVSSVLMDEFIYNSVTGLLTHSIRLRNGALYFQCRDINYIRKEKFYQIK